MNGSLWAFMPGGGGENQDEMRKASRDAATAGREVADLKEKVRHLELITQAIWELLRESAQLTEADLIQKVREVDLGNTEASPKQCGACSQGQRAL